MQPATEPAAQPPAAETYAVKIHRPFTMGQVIDVDVEANQTSKAAVENEQKQTVGLSEQLNFHLVGEVTIDEVAPDGRAAAATLKVTSFVNPMDQSAVLPAGSVIHAKRGADGMLAPVLEGGTLTDAQMRLLTVAFPLERPGSRLGDELFGTPERRAVGDTWPFNRAYVVDDLREEGWVASETGIDGVVKLQEIVPCGKTECLKLQIDMTAKSASMVVVEGASDVGTGDLTSTITLEVPVDETTPVHREDATTTLTFAATATQGEETMHRGLAVSRHRRATYLPKK